MSGRAWTWIQVHNINSSLCPKTDSRHHVVLRAGLELVQAVAHRQPLEEELDGALAEEGADTRQQPVPLQHHANDAVRLGPESNLRRLSP